MGVGTTQTTSSPKQVTALLWSQLYHQNKQGVNHRRLLIYKYSRITDDPTQCPRRNEVQPIGLASSQLGRQLSVYKHSLCKQEDLRSNPQNPHKR